MDGRVFDLWVDSEKGFEKSWVANFVSGCCDNVKWQQLHCQCLGVFWQLGYP